MQAYTIALSQWRKAKTRDVELLDITVKSGVATFAPEEKLLWAYKRGEVSEEDYRTAYLARLETSLRNNPEAFEGLLERTEPIALACYCRAGVFCHRHILVEFLSELADDNDMHFKYLGELT